MGDLPAPQLAAALIYVAGVALFVGWLLTRKDRP
jgi:hypothetical protein